MKRFKQNQLKIWAFLSLISFFLMGVPGSSAYRETSVELSTLLPSIEGMESSEPPDTYFPESLFEYINGAAEIYLAYDFKELIVAQYANDDMSNSVVVEIYDMGNNKNAFGIYSAERYPESAFIELGTQGYIEEGALNFLVGKYYVKLLCYDCGDRSDQWLRAFSGAIVKRVENEDGFPLYLQTFPKKGSLPNTEKFILKNVMGYKFLHDGYIVSYKTNDVAFDCFLIEGKTTEEAKDMLTKYLDAKGADSVQEIPTGFRIKDRYYHNIFVARVNNILCGVMKIPDEFLKTGESYLQQFVQSVKGGI